MITDCQIKREKCKYCANKMRCLPFKKMVAAFMPIVLTGALIAYPDRVLELGAAVGGMMEDFLTPCTDGIPAFGD